MEELSLTDIVAIFKRRRAVFFSTFAILFVIASIFALNWSTYRAEATVEIEQSVISENLAVPAGGNPQDAMFALADQRISQIEQKVTSLGSLAEIITKFDLYPKQRKNVPIAMLADKMRNNIKLDFISSKFSNPVAEQKETAEQLAAIAFTLGFDYSNPQIAQEVVNELISRFLDEDLKMRRKQAQDTSDFLGSQIAALEATMVDQEKKIADFRAKNGESGPAALMFNEQAASSTNYNLQQLESQITANEGTQGSLRAQLATVDPYSRVVANGQVMTTPAVQLKALESEYATMSGQYGPDYPDLIKLRDQIKALKAEIASKGGNTTAAESGESADLKAKIADLRTNIAAAQATEGADNPDVASLKRQLKAMERRLKASDGAPSDNFMKKDADNPAYLELSEQLKAAEEQHKSLLAERETLEAEQQKYQAKIAANPVIEQQMESLSRDYENAQLRYRELKEKKMAADMTVQLEQDKKGERLSVTNPPEVPMNTHPSRMLLMLGGILMSMMGGVAGVIISEALNQSIHGQDQLAYIVGAAPLAVIPYLANGAEARRASRLNKHIMKAATLVGFFAMVICVFMAVPL